MERKYHSNLAFNDLLFNILFGFVILFIIAFLLINPISKKADIPLKAEFVVIVEWPYEQDADVDTWLKGPNGDLVGFRNKESVLLHLDRDDLGNSNDTLTVAGETIVNKVNREFVTIRGIVPGDYFLSIHLYSLKTASLPIVVNVSVMDVNPYKEAYILQVQLDEQGQELILPGFTIDSKGAITKTFNHTNSIVPLKPTEQDREPRSQQ